MNNKNKHIVEKIGFITGILSYIILFYFFIGGCMCGHGNFRWWKHWTMEFNTLSPLDEITLNEEEILEKQRDKYGITQGEYENLINKYKD